MEEELKTLFKQWVRWRGSYPEWVLVLCMTEKPQPAWCRWLLLMILKTLRSHQAMFSLFCCSLCSGHHSSCPIYLSQWIYSLVYNVGCDAPLFSGTCWKQCHCWCKCILCDIILHPLFANVINVMQWILLPNDHIYICMASLIDLHLGSWSLQKSLYCKYQSLKKLQL